MRLLNFEKLLRIALNAFLLCRISHQYLYYAIFYKVVNVTCLSIGESVCGIQYMRVILATLASNLHDQPDCTSWCFISALKEYYRSLEMSTMSN